MNVVSVIRKIRVLPDKAVIYETIRAPTARPANVSLTVTAPPAVGNPFVSEGPVWPVLRMPTAQHKMNVPKILPVSHHPVPALTANKALAVTHKVVVA